MSGHQPYGPQGSFDERYVTNARLVALRSAIRDRLSHPDPGSVSAGFSGALPVSSSSDAGYFHSYVGVDDPADEEAFLAADEGEHPGDSDSVHEGDFPPTELDPGEPGFVDTSPSLPQRSNVWRLLRRELEVKVVSIYVSGEIPTVAGFGYQLLGTSLLPAFLKQPARGVAINQRVGDRIMLRRVHIRGTWHPSQRRPSGDWDGDIELRFVFGLNRSPMRTGSTVALSNSDIFDTSSGGEGVHQDFAVWNKQRYTIFRDQRYRGVIPHLIVLDYAEHLPAIPFEMDVDINSLMDFNSDGVAVNLSPFVWFSQTDESGYIDFKIYFYFSDC